MAVLDPIEEPDEPELMPIDKWDLEVALLSHAKALRALGKLTLEMVDAGAEPVHCVDAIEDVISCCERAVAGLAK